MTAQPTHAAIVSEGVIYFIYSFDAAHPIDIRKAANRLLKAEIAETVVSPRDGEVRVAHRYQSLVRLMNHSNAIREISEALEQHRLLRWAIRHPIWAMRIFAGSGSRRSRATDESADSTISQRIEENVAFIQRAVAEYQSVNAIQHHIERDLLRIPYLVSEPYLRLRLRSAGQWLVRMNGGGVRPPGNLDEGIRADVLLLIHRSGVMQLTVALRMPDNITVEQYREMAFGSSNVVSASRISEPVLKAAYGRRAQRYLTGEWEPDTEEGVRWRLTQHGDLASVSDLFELYYEAIINAIKGETSGDWFCYPAVFFDKVECCDSETSFKGAHEDELKNAIARSVDVSEIRPEAMADMIPEDCSLTRHTSLYCNMASSLEVRWPGSREGEFAQHLQRLVIFESALLQYWQIRLLDRRVGVTNGRVSQVREIQREAIFGLREYRDSSISFGTAIDLADRLLKEWRADRLYSLVLESIDQLQQLVVAAESEKSARRANVLAGTALIVAIFLGLPAINDTLDIAQDVKMGGFLGIFLEPFHALASRGEEGTWIGYLMFLSAVLACLLALKFKRGRPRAWRRRRRPGIAWPLGTVRIERRDDSQDG
ncbi:hypothetical protein TUSST3_77460 [Streptomyces sp. TUS-ST3]|uniref:hypothetical protein n=1 Tax=Streptomyces sp. TUS-ST3 TaxID=3025591 RepID=UPI00235B43B9|nr:hypothetical protein [Streptomyces sp. TUS-ST3]GLP71126.1 hypothetical protein TUSST3_77460 [Streptomyces sp. TUS-ST3]